MMIYKAGCVSGWKGIRNHDDRKRLITVMCRGPAKHRTRAANPAELRRNKRHTEGAFSCLPSIMVAGVGTLRGGRPLSPVLATRTSPPPKPLTEAADSINTAQESNMSQDTHQGTAPKTHPILQDATVLQRAVTTLEASSLLLERLHMQPDPHLMLGIVIDQLRRTVIDLEGLRHD